jgi:hypothetical protein
MSTGALHFNGNFAHEDGTIEIEIGGTSAGSLYDQMLIAGTLRLLGGDLNVTLANAFMPGAGDSFDVLGFSALDGTFATVNLPELSGALQWDKSRLYSDGVLSVILPGDYNNNGTVDSADYVLWRNGGPLANEVSNPGTVEAQDYTEWRTRFGNTQSGSAASLQTIPEPGSWTMISAALLLVTVAKRGPYF